MIEYISKWTVIEALHELKQKSPTYFELPLEKAIEKIRDIPAADVRPVVTCGECKHWFENGTDYCSCDRDALLRERVFFCAGGGKRKES